MDINKIKGAKLFSGLLLGLSINLLIVRSLQFDLSSQSIVLYHTMLWCGMYLYRQLQRRTQIFLVLGSTIFGMISYKKITLWEPGYDFFKWSLLYISGSQIEIHSQYVSFLTLLLFGIVNFLILKYMLFTKSKWLRLIPGTYFVVQWYRYIDQAFIYLQFYLFALMLLTIIDNYTESGLEEKIYGERNQLFSISGWLGYSLFISVSIIGVANLMPVQFKALQVRELADRISERIPYIMDWRSEEDFLRGENKSQISGERLGGPLLRDERTVMLVKAEQPLYLRGNIKAVYIGSGWRPSRKSFKKSGVEGKIPSVSSYDISFENQKVEVQPLGINTKVLYAPYRPTQVLLPSGNVYYDDAYELYRRWPFFSNRKQTYTVYSEIPRFRTLDSVNGHQGTYPVSQVYFDLPHGLPIRVKKLAEDLTAEVEGDYNKIKAIEHYLRENHPYTLEGETLPVGMDFVDYFLFETKKGYCSYYASALAVLGRCIGIPTRYVEGFILPKEKNKEGIYEVAASNAHAWVEAYIEGHGWISFEPTPAYTAVEAFTQNEARQNEVEFSINQVDQGIENNTLEHLRNRGERGEDIFVSEADTVRPKGYFHSISALFILLVLMLILRISYCAFNNRKLLNIASGQMEILQYYRKIVSLGSYVDGMSTQGCTPREVLVLLGSRMCPNLLDQRLIHSVERGLYSLEESTTEDIALMKTGCSELEIAVKKQLGFPKYWFLKYVAGDLYKNRKKKRRNQL